MQDLVVPPDPALLESMRAIGYTVESAVADVIDNSIAAGAQRVEVLISASGPFQLAVLDDGSGMSPTDAVNAMKLAATSPTVNRQPDDLGRFGLGMKTASLSQCRELTLVTRKNGELTALRWSLDHLMATGNWSLLRLEESHLEGLIGWSQFRDSQDGTLVHWGSLDHLRLSQGDQQGDLDRVALRVRDHMALVFHRFISGDGARRIQFLMNGREIDPIDPFLSRSPKIQKSSWESIDVDGHSVHLMAYTLPYLNRMSSRERKAVLSHGTLRDTQGFYVYRAARLVIWGTWFRVTPRTELAKLTRVRVDIPNTLDHLWSLDVKKSKADPPPQIRSRLKELARTMTLPSEQVQTYRGRRVQQTPSMDMVWALNVNGDRFNYEINLDHPTIEAFTRTLSERQRKQFGLLLADIQTTFPIIDAHNRMSGDGLPPDSEPDEALLDRAEAAWELSKGTGLSWDVEDFITATARAEPYASVTNFAQHLRRRLESDS